MLNKEEEGKKKINGFDRSVWWSEAISFRANHHYYYEWKIIHKKCALVSWQLWTIQWSFFVKQSYYIVTFES